MKKLGKHSQQQLEKTWKRALKSGVCPFAGCDLKTYTCPHLDRYLEYHPGYREKDIEARQVRNVDELGAAQQPQGEVWNLFRKLRKFGLDRDQISIVIRHFAYGMSSRQIELDMGYVSYKTVQRRLADALETLKRRGYGK